MGNFKKINKLNRGEMKNVMGGLVQPPSGGGNGCKSDTVPCASGTPHWMYCGTGGDAILVAYCYTDPQV